MERFLVFAYLFFIGSLFGWVLEFLFRNLLYPEVRWMNPGFCRGPYLPIYGFGLCALYVIASTEKYFIPLGGVGSKIAVFVIMAVCMTAIEYIAGLCCLKIFKVRLWDYSDCKFNLQGIICPQFSIAWAALGMVYYFVVHPYVINALEWLAQNLAFSFVIGMFFGVFAVDMSISIQLVAKLKKFAEEHNVEITYENIKERVHRKQLELRKRYTFFRPFKLEMPIGDYLKELHSEAFFKIKDKRK